MIKAVLFDLDDTLVQTMKTKFAAAKYFASHFYGITLTDELIRAQWGKPIPILLASLVGNTDAPDRMMEKYISIRPRFPSIAYDDAVPTVTHLLTRFTVGVISAANREFVIDDLTKLSFPVDKLTVVQGAEDTPVHKPDPKVFDPSLATLETFGIGKHEIVYIGDMLTDYFAARDAGLSFIGIADRTTPKSMFDNENVRTVENLTRLLDILK